MPQQMPDKHILIRTSAIQPVTFSILQIIRPSISTSSITKLDAQG